MAARSEDVAPEQVRSAFASLSGGAAVFVLSRGASAFPNHSNLGAERSSWR